MYRVPLEKMHVLGIRYRRTAFDANDERGLDAYAAADVYACAGVPFSIEEPRVDPAERTGDPVLDLGRFNGRIADAVSAARQSGSAILMTGGDCSHATGVVGGLQQAHGAGLRLGLVWFDAHGDFNTPSTSLSGSLGGMPVAVCAGLAYPQWREAARIASPLSTNRILFVDVRNLDEAEAALIEATDAVIAASAPGFAGESLERAIEQLAEQCDAIYLHIDADILDRSLVPSHGTGEPGGPDMAQTMAAIEAVMGTGKVIAFALVSIYNQGSYGLTSVQSGVSLLKGALLSWRSHGTAKIPLLTERS